MESLTYKRCLTIAGSDPSGGAGIQADLKTFSALGCYGMSAIVAVVDENTIGVSGLHPIPAGFVEGQIRSCLDDIGADAIKIGMLHSAELVEAVRRTLDCYPEISNIVLDPVMVATSGDPLLEMDAIGALKSVLIPRARVITPNIPEAELLLGEKINTQADLPDFARKLSDSCAGVSVLLKAGHLTESKLVDVFYNAELGETVLLESARLDTLNTHGTGCTLSSAFAACLAKGMSLNEAAMAAKDYVSEAIAVGSGYAIGQGHGPVHHFARWWR